MKTSNLWGILLFALCLTQYSYAKKIALSTELTCEQKTAIVLPYANDFKTYPLATLKEMIEYLAPCVIAEDMGAIYATGVLTLYTKKNRDDFQTERDAINLMTKAADANYKPAILGLGTLYLTGAFYKFRNSGIYGKAIKLFEKMLTLNYKPDLANYAIGYMRMKGVINRQQRGNYAQARSHFRKSNHPMAKHWLALMDYHGYGTTSNIPKKAEALQALQENDILNSRVLRESLLAQNTDWIPISSEEDRSLRHGGGNFSTDPYMFNQTFQGKFVEYDWGWQRNKVKRFESFTMKFNQNSNGTIGYELNINGKTITGQGRLTSFNLVIPLKNIYQDHPDKEEIEYKFERFPIKKSEINGEPVLIIAKPKVTMLDRDFEEQVYNVGMILRPEATTPTSLGISNTLRNGQPLSGTQKDNADFAVISPNPINEQFTITYNFNAPTEVKVEIYDLYGNQKIDIPMQRTNGIGHKTLPIDSSNLSKGIYLVQMTVNGVAYSKTIAKN